LAFDDHTLARPNAFFDHGEAIHALTDRDRSPFDRIILADDIDEIALWSLFDRRRRHGRDAAQETQDHPDIDKFPRPEALRHIGEIPFQSYRAARLVDLVVDEGEPAPAENALAVGGKGGERQGPFALPLADRVEIALRQREADQNGLQPIDRYDRNVVSSMHNIAHTQEACTELAGDRRRYMRIVEIEPRRLDPRLVGHDRGLHLIDKGLLLIILLAGLEARREKAAVSLEVE
jgi:hypothetical protein